MKNSKKGFILPLVIIVAAVIAVGGGTYIYTKNHSSTTTNTTEGVNGETTEEPSGMAPTLHTDWKTYTNVQLGVSFQHPPDWKIVSETSTSIKVEDTKHPSKPDSDTPSNFVTISISPETKQSKNWALGFGDIYWKTTYNADKNTLITFSALTKADQTIEDRIAASVNFTSQASGSKKYNGSLYSFSYPSTWTALEANSQLGLTILYPNSKSDLVINKTISTTDKVTIAIVNGQMNTSGTQQISLNGQTWYVKNYGTTIDGGTENAVSYYKTLSSGKYVEITSGVSNKSFIETAASTFVSK